MTATPSISKLFTVAALCGTALLGACASAARPEMMTASAASIPAAAASDPTYKAVTVGSVSGGGETNPMWMSGVSANDFRTALESSLRGTNHLADASGGARYSVAAQLLNVDRPMMGLDMTTTTSVNYKVTSAADSSVVFDQSIQAQGTAKMGQALLGAERLRLANEASIRANIEAFIKAFRTRLGQPQTSAAR